MLPQKKMDHGTNANHETEIHSSEPHLVVACPSCKTKFAVESSVIASFEIPRFHCSRCDKVFEMNSSALQPSQPTSNSREPRWVIADEAPVSEETPIEQPKDSRTRFSEISQATLKSSDFTLGPISAPTEQHQPFTLVDDHSGLSLLGLKRSSPAAITRSEALTRTQFTAPAEPVDTNPFSMFDSPSAERPEETTSAQPKPIPVVPTMGSAMREMNEDRPRLSTYREPSRTAPQTHRQHTPPVAEQQEPVTHSRPRALSYRGRSLLRLATPLVAAMAVLSVLGYSAYVAPKAVDTVLSAITPGFIKGAISLPPPAELSVRGVSLEFTRTQSRESIGVVRGVLRNASHQNFDNVRLEALAFDQHGEIVARAQAPLRSALGREKISDLTLPTVIKFQESLSARSAAIAPGEDVAFSIAFVPPSSNEAEAGRVDLSRVRYFSARVFSVEK